MALNKQLGLYWGNNTLYFTEVVSSKMATSFSIPLDFHKPAQTDDNKFISTSMQLVSNIEAQLKTHKISSTTANLSLPTKDIIFRSFIIPWMSSSEIRGVVTFEISKYIPFSLEELWYSFYPITITVNNTKKLRIIFVAVRKDTLENYTNILESAGLQINVIEPCSQSIIRTLIFQKLIDKDTTTAIVEKGELAGKITIVEQGVPQFVREFQLKTPGKENADQAEATARLVNEIRISIDYFTRQENFNPVSEIKILISNPSEDLAQNVSTDLGIRTTSVLLQDILPSPEVNNIAYLNAFGVGIHNIVNLASSFDLSKKDNKKAKAIGAAPSNLVASYSSVFTTLIICGGIAVLTFLGSKGLTDTPKKNVEQLEKELGSYKDTLIEKIQNTTKTTEATLKHLKTINTKSNIAYFLTTFPMLLPEGVWIKTMDVKYPEASVKKDKKVPEKILPSSATKPVISLSGYAYSDNIRDQFKLVNQLLKNIREHQQLSTIFSQITLETVKADKSGDVTVTFYQIQCQ